MQKLDYELVVATPEALRRGFKTLVSELARDAIAARGRFALAIPGGSVVSVLLEGLQASDADWRATELFWCDERAVPAQHADSNYGASMAGWLGALFDSGIRTHRMEAEVGSLDDACRRYERVLVDTLGATPILDLAVVGVGEDGHIASLFPDSSALAEEERSVIGVEDAPKHPRRRVTLTLPMIARTRCLVVAAFGHSKRDVVRCALEEPTCRLPVARAMRATTRCVILLDDAAASSLQMHRRPSGT